MHTLNLFSDLEDACDATGIGSGTFWAAAVDDVGMAGRAKSVVSGLDYIPDFLSRAEEWELLQRVDEGPWSTHWQRRTQHYGRRYQVDEGVPGTYPQPLPKGKGVPRKDALGDHLPWWSLPLRERLVERGIFAHLPNQMGINEYLPGQGIAPHVDYHGGEVVSITLGTGCLMNFTPIDDVTVDHDDEHSDAVNAISTWLAPRSIVILKGPARHIWHHGIARRKKDVVDSRIIPRGRRVSVTFRYIE